MPKKKAPVKKSAPKKKTPIPKKAPPVKKSPVKKSTPVKVVREKNYTWYTKFKHSDPVEILTHHEQVILKHTQIRNIVIGPDEKIVYQVMSGGYYGENELRLSDD